MPRSFPPKQGDASLFIRSDFTQPDRWREVCAAADAEVFEFPDTPFHARLIFVDDPANEEISPDEVAALAADDPGHRVVFVVDSLTLAAPDRPILAVDTSEQPGTTIRVVPQKVWMIENNINEVNVSFGEYADRAATTPDGVLR